MEQLKQLMENGLSRGQHTLSWFLGQLAVCQIPWVKNRLNHWLVKTYGIDLSEAAAGTQPEDYPSMQALFTRALKPEARPISAGASDIVSPADGFWGPCGAIHSDQTLVQAKGQNYPLKALLGGNAAWAAGLDRGSYMTIYLAPHNYHRVHMPCEGRLTDMVHVGGTLFPVRPSSTQKIPELFSRNERVITWFETAQGPVAVIFIGALCVGGISCVWHGPVVPRHAVQPTQTVWHYDHPICFQKGDELGYFSFGSTVVILYPEGVSCAPGAPDQPVKMGEKIGEISGSE